MAPPRSSVSPVTLPVALALAACAGLAACGARTPPTRTAALHASVDGARDVPDATDEAPRFSDRIAPIAKERCDDCHAKAPGGAMSVYRNARPFIEPGDPEASVYFTLPKGHPPSWGDEAGVVRAWIAAGARE